MFKKLLLLLITLSVAFTNMNADKIYSIIDDTTLVIHDNTSYISTYTLPSDSATRQNIRKVVLPNSIRSIGSSSFYHYVNLKDINLSDTIREIDSNAFLGCDKLPARVLVYHNGENCYGWIGDRDKCVDITIPQSVKQFDVDAFKDCKNLVSVTFPDSLETIESGAFKNCSNLKSVIFPKNLQTIGFRSFYNCTSLTSLTLPSSLERVYSSAFDSCLQIAHVDMPDNIAYMDESAFSLDNPYTKELMNQYGYINDSEYIQEITEINGDTLVVKEGVKYIPVKAFQCSEYKYIRLPQSTKIIRNHAFSWCRNIRTIILPDSIETIEYYAFKGCSNLKFVRFPQGLKSIESQAFSQCDNLQFVILRDSVKEIGNGAFSHCENLKSVVFPDGIEEIPDDCFESCKHLKKVKLGNVKQINSCAFHNCYRLSEINISDDCQMEYYAFSNCFFLHQLNIISPNCDNSALGFYTILDESIAEYFFDPLTQIFRSLRHLLLLLLIVAEIGVFISLKKEIPPFTKKPNLRHNIVMAGIVSSFLGCTRAENCLLKILILGILTVLGYFLFKKFPQVTLILLIIIELSCCLS